MTLDTILQILYANDMTEVIVLATQIDNNIAVVEKAAGDNIKVDVNSSDLKKLNLEVAGEKGERYRNIILLPVVAVNKYALKKRYLVNIAGELRWVEESTDYSLTPVQPIQEQILG